MKPNYLIIPLLTFITAFIGSNITSKGMNWYKTINLPSFAPPGSIIGTIWTIIFILTALSAIIFWNHCYGKRNYRLVVLLFLVNALLNIAWSYIFFGLNLIGLAIFEAGLLGLSVLILIILIYPYSILAAGLLSPYFIWVSFATYLNYTIWTLNK